MLGNRLPSLFKTPKAKQFEFKPRYYNEMKERLAEQERRVLKEIEFQKKLDDDPELKLREKMRKKWGTESREEANKKANKRVLIIATFLGAIAYYFLIK